jgi:hypothetical protein
MREVSTTSPAARRRWIAFDIFDHHGAVKYSIAWVTSLPVDKEADCGLLVVLGDQRNGPDPAIPHGNPRPPAAKARLICR